MTEEDSFEAFIDSLEFTSYRCDMCEVLFDVTDKQVTCPHCKHVNRRTPLTKDCPYCKAVRGMTLMYQTEGQYARPYICHNCLKDENGRQYPEYPTDPTHLASMGFV